MWVKIRNNEGFNTLLFYGCPGKISIYKDIFNMAYILLLLFMEL